MAYLPIYSGLPDASLSDISFGHDYNMGSATMPQMPITPQYDTSTPSSRESLNLWTWVDGPGSIDQDTLPHGKSTRKSVRRGKGRWGPLHPDTRREAREMREIRACLPCWARKVKVSHRNHTVQICKLCKWSLLYFD